ncbi:DUF72 domain-containing protein [Sphingobacterium sp. SRCM116780]|uniref:DUF72 domain-containing protein n=1 Tax=Sphingobacterium sp. SRCM116780 TaxID=2907623 RepID=UPI001F339567|nr:DUF72 domain-containing protein [Sphingobacterium sp. SRCM116780]UIR56369.1 DUF72 domain-containing protein [Sphingobacterium sp. SRCM116780]
MSEGLSIIIAKEMSTEQLWIGCSSYTTPSWQTLFYPTDLPKSKWFAYYCQYFKTYEFNATFYRFPTVKNLLSWHDKTPDHFEFSVKVPKIITHIKKLQDCTEEVSDFYQISKEGLKNKLACILWQSPPSFSFTRERLDLLISLMDSHFENVVEFRHVSWCNTEATKDLEKNSITFCNPNYPHLPTSIQQTTTTGYFRLHGNPQLFYSEYSKKEITDLYEEIKNYGFKKVYIYFNNTASTAAIKNALQLLELIKQ